MLRFSDFSHLPEVDGLIEQILAEPSGLILIAGLDSRPGSEPAADILPHFLPSGRATIFRVLLSELLEAHPRLNCLIVAEDKDVFHTARQFRRRVEFLHVKPPLTYAEAIESVHTRHPGVLAVDRVTADNLMPLLAAARSRIRVLAQIDTVYHAHSVARYLGDLGAAPHDLAGLRWILSIQRFPALCPVCKRPAQVTDAQLAQLETFARRFPDALQYPSSRGAFFAPDGCPKCRFTGRQGDVAAFDILRVGNVAEMWTRPSVLPLEVYIWMLAQRGQLALTDALQFESQQLHRTYSLLRGSERQLSETAATLERKLVELDSANNLLKQRTRELISLEAMGQALITWSDLRELGSRVIKAAMELSKADRGILYYLRSAEWGQILASRGWSDSHEEMGLPRPLIYADLSDRDTRPFVGTPPGLEPPADAAPLRAGLAVPLVAHGIPAGLMLIQSTRKNQFVPGEVAILQTLAGYAAIAMQRAGLVEQLQSKIDALEEAQDELAQKERLERELELARQVQQSMIPRTFPTMRGLTFAASYAPARQVGGDFYDVIRLDDERVALVIADVADKGMPAALYMALARSLILAEARQFDAPETVLRNVNQLLLELGEQDMFVTVFYGLLDRRQGTLTYTRAGHDHPLLVRDGRATALGGRGMALGLFDAATFTMSQEVMAVEPGDRLILFTDGLTDVVGPDGRMASRDQLVNRVKACAYLPPAEICRTIFDELSAYREETPQFDDMALLVVGIE